MKTKIFHSSFIVLALILNIYLSGCGGSLKEPPPKPKFKAPKDHCDTVISNVTHNLNAVIYINLGNGSITGAYMKVGKTCFFRHRLNWGSTTSLAGSMTLTLPFTPVGAGAAAGRLYDNSANGAYTGSLVWGTTTTATYAGDPGVVTAITPFTWATNDYAIVSGVIETT